ncbi:hypothetical protein IBX73_02675 [candidate division WOR-3 bacterium]|nr:hypothetical protein [candidate division WOR-3 bacterium]
MDTFLEHLATIFDYVVRESSAENIVGILYEKIKRMTEARIIERDIDNFIAYFRLILSTSRIPKKLTFDTKLIRAFVDRTYTEFTPSAQEFRANRLYASLKNKIDEGADIEIAQLERLETTLISARKPSLDSIMEHVQIAMLLKWLQGPVRSKLSRELQDYIALLGTIHGKSQRNLVPDTECQKLEVNAEDMSVIKKEYRNFEKAINESVKAAKDARSKRMDSGKYEDQFRIIISSLDNLVKMSEKGTMNSVQSFKDKVIVAAALIYIQDEFVRKDPQLERTIQLFVSLYHQFRDRP